MVKINEKQLIQLILDAVSIKKREETRKKKVSGYNKRYYQKNKTKILAKNKEMRDVYKIVKRN